MRLAVFGSCVAVALLCAVYCAGLVADGSWAWAVVIGGVGVNGGLVARSAWEMDR